MFNILQSSLLSRWHYFNNFGYSAFGLTDLEDSDLFLAVCFLFFIYSGIRVWVTPPTLDLLQLATDLPCWCVAFLSLLADLNLYGSLTGVQSYLPVNGTPSSKSKFHVSLSFCRCIASSLRTNCRFLSWSVGPNSARQTVDTAVFLSPPAACCTGQQTSPVLIAGSDCPVSCSSLPGLLVCI